MKCSIMLRFICVFTVCQCTRLGVSTIQRVGSPVCDVFLTMWFCHLPMWCQGWEWCLIVSIPDLCIFPYFNCDLAVMFASLFGFVLMYFPLGAMGCHAICDCGINWMTMHTCFLASLVMIWALIGVNGVYLSSAKLISSIIFIYVHVTWDVCYNKCVMACILSALWVVFHSRRHIASKQRRMNGNATSIRHIDVHTTLFQRFGVCLD